MEPQDTEQIKQDMHQQEDYIKMEVGKVVKHQV